MDSLYFKRGGNYIYIHQKTMSILNVFIYKLFYKKTKKIPLLFKCMKSEDPNAFLIQLLDIFVLNVLKMCRS